MTRLLPRRVDLDPRAMAQLTASWGACKDDDVLQASDAEPVA